jgi:myb proto-oncogene protein
MNHDQHKSKTKFTKEEDELIVMCVDSVKEKNEKVRWKEIASKIPSRTNRQIRERYMNFLNPDVNRNPLTEYELIILMKIVALHANASSIPWKMISKSFPGRTDIFLKNNYGRIKRKLSENLSKSKLRKRFYVEFDQLLWNDTNIDQIKYQQINVE